MPDFMRIEMLRQLESFCGLFQETSTELQMVKGFDVTSGQLSVQGKFSGKMFYFSLREMWSHTPWKL
jgi:hypothetical protein